MTVIAGTVVCRLMILRRYGFSGRTFPPVVISSGTETGGPGLREVPGIAVDFLAWLGVFAASVTGIR